MTVLQAQLMEPGAAHKYAVLVFRDGQEVKSFAGQKVEELYQHAEEWVASCRWTAIRANRMLTPNGTTEQQSRRYLAALEASR